jgi:hypothetical protein
MKRRFELGSAEEDLWNDFISYNKVKYFFLFFIGFFSGVAILSIIFLSVI